METLRHHLLRLAVVLLMTFSSGREYGRVSLVACAKQSSNPAVPALFVFGDSVVDAGTNTLFPSLIQADFKPYGMVYFGKATGRFTNGRTYADFFATNIGLPLVEPYLKRKGKSSVMRGVNYASAGSGLLNTTNAGSKVIPYSDQLLQFGQTKSQIEQALKSKAAAMELFSKSLFLISIGANDVFGYLFNQSLPQQVFIDGLLVILNASVEVLYKAGARKVMFLGSGPLGCFPGVLAAAGVTNGQCVKSWNDIIVAYNTALEKYVLSLHETFPHLKAIVGKSFSTVSDFITNGEKYGFTAGVTACCGSGLYNGGGQCGRPADLITNPPTNLCDEVDEYVFWDLFHLTDKAYGLVAKDFWSGNSSFVAPVNLQTLVSS